MCGLYIHLNLRIPHDTETIKIWITVIRTIIESKLWIIDTTRALLNQHP